tara:strand:+ start:642 stop:1001 length:360 start_codon:yes stop_codon:yes gene_type:complete
MDNPLELSNFEPYELMSLPKGNHNYIRQFKYLDKFYKSEIDLMNIKTVMLSAIKIFKEGKKIKSEKAAGENGEYLILHTINYEGVIYQIACLHHWRNKNHTNYYRADKICFANVIVEPT